MSKKTRVVVGMSGGVDSSVTAALLKDQGYDVIGMTLQLLPKEEERLSACCNLGAISDARRVCQKLNIPHYTINSRDNFQKHVIDPFINSYAIGETPNPCVECNRFIKFEELWHHGSQLGADYVASGHYCTITKENDGVHTLRKAEDDTKDQSYFLYMMNQETLRRTLFPLGSYKKSEIREMAARYQLINADKAESQEICFVSSKSYKDFVKKHIPDHRRIPGNIVDKDGNVLTQHEGIYAFTIGQRKGLNISAPHPLYVIGIDPKTHIVTVGQKEDLDTPSITIHTLSLVNEEEDVIGKVLEMKIRYRMTPFEGKITQIDRDSRTATIEALSPPDFVAPGQSLVLYEGSRIVGGGVICR